MRSVSIIFSQILNSRLRKHLEIWKSRQSLMLDEGSMLGREEALMGWPNALDSAAALRAWNFSAALLHTAVNSMITLDRTAGLNYKEQEREVINNVIDAE